MIGAIPEFIYSVADDGIYIDLYAPSAIEHQTKKGKLAFEMITDFPYDKKVNIKINNSEPVEAKVRIRIPSWAIKKMAVIVNGKTAGTGKPGSYLTLNRQWKKGDLISFSLPAGLKTTKYEGLEDAYRGRYALEYGPVLMAYTSMKGEKENIALQIRREKLIKALKPAPGKPLHFTVNGTEDFEFRPYFEIQEESFSCFP
jgi:DUF1680 family protein